MKTSKMGMAHYSSKATFLHSKALQLAVNAEDRILSDLSAEFEIEMFKNSTDKIPKIRAKAIIHDLDLSLSSVTYPAIQKIGNCFSLPPSQEAEVKKQVEKQRANEKSEVMKGSRKIGIIYEQSKAPIKYIAVLTGSYLYLYQDKKDVQYKTYFYIKNSKYETIEETDPIKKPLSLVIENSVNKFVLGFDKEATLQEWKKAFQQIEHEENSMLMLTNLVQATITE